LKKVPPTLGVGIVKKEALAKKVFFTVVKGDPPETRGCPLPRAEPGLVERNLLRPPVSTG